MTARNRFINLQGEQAISALEHQSVLAVDAMYQVINYPWIYTNAGCLAEAAAHWAFTVNPSLRVDDTY